MNIFFFATLKIMPNVFNQSLWGDEAFSAVLSMNPIPKILEIIQKDTSPPLYNIILHYWYQIFGTSEIAIRALSFLFFILAVFFVYKIGSLLFSRRIGLLAAVLTFLNPFFFTYAFEGRMYSILADQTFAQTLVKILIKPETTSSASSRLVTSRGFMAIGYSRSAGLKKIVSLIRDAGI